jgi:hypothetical protein
MIHIRRGAGWAVVDRANVARTAGRSGSQPDRIAMGLLGDLLNFTDRELLARTGLALQRGRLGTWLVGEEER